MDNFDFPTLALPRSGQRSKSKLPLSPKAPLNEEKTIKIAICYIGNIV